MLVSGLGIADVPTLHYTLSHVQSHKQADGKTWEAIRVLGFGLAWLNRKRNEFAFGDACFSGELI